MDHRKSQSPAKITITAGPVLDHALTTVLDKIVRFVGSTLGPGGRPVLLAKQGADEPPDVTKDGVTALRGMGELDPVQHEIMLLLRDAAIRTVNLAGDGTTTVTVLSAELTLRLKAFIKANPRYSPQKVCRRLEQVFAETIEPALLKQAYKPALGTPEGRKLLLDVARTSTNGDTELSAKVLECFDIAGDDGSVITYEDDGPTGYRVVKINGYNLPLGYEESCRRYAVDFINDTARQMVRLNNPLFLLYFGRIEDGSDIAALDYAMEDAIKANPDAARNVVLVCTGLSERVLYELALNFKAKNSLVKILPLAIPPIPLANGEMEFLKDLQALTGATIFSQTTKQLAALEYSDLGEPLEYVELTRYSTSIVGSVSDDLLFARIDEVDQRMRQAASDLERAYLAERKAKISGGLVQLRVIGASKGDTKERRDRAEDALLAIRGSTKHGVLPGGGTMFCLLTEILLNAYPDDPVVRNILIPALLKQPRLLFANAGYSEDEIDDLIGDLCVGKTYDILAEKWVGFPDGGVLDSTPSIVEGIRGSIGNAKTLGVMAGVSVYARDAALEREAAERWEQYQAMMSVEAPPPA